MRVAVLGAGLQGACVALELAAAGIKVDLYDKQERCVTQASAQNEGKIHLGYVYANDRTLNTARTMIQGTLVFATLLRRWLGSEIEKIPVSAPFHYVVHAASLLSVAEVEHHFRHAHRLALAASGGALHEYFGSDYRVPPARLSAAECAAHFDEQNVAAAFKTAEIGIDPEVMAALIRARLAADAKIHCLLRAHVRGVEQNAQGVTVDFDIAGGRARERYDHVVNTLWDGRLAIDKTVGLAPEHPWLYRVKHYLRVRATALAALIPCTTIILGAFGDIVVYGDGDFYLSWYPAGMRGASSDLSPPAWPLVLDEPDAREMQRTILAGLTGIVPAVTAFNSATIESCQVKAGIIFAWGQTDIDDPASGLHQRYAIGPRTHGRYHTVDTGKLTMAPLFGKLMARRIAQIGSSGF